jgi:hypothetical protein
VLFEGFDEKGNQKSEGVDKDDVTFTNNKDGTWTVSFVKTDWQDQGSITFAASEISDINLRDGGSVIVYSYNDGTDTYDVV